MATLAVEGDELVLRLTPMEKLGGFHGDIRVPLAAVDGVEVCERPFSGLRGLRWLGTGFPGLVALGTFRAKGGARDFAALYRRSPVVVVSLRAGKYERLLVSAGDAAAVAERIRTAR